MRDLLGALLAGILTVAAAILFMNYQGQSNVNQQVAATAGQAVQFNTAVQSYITQYASNVSAVATATTPAIITVPMLQASSVNLLPSSFSSTNPFGQTWQAEVLQPTAGNLQALALGVGGTALSDQVASRVAALIGSAGGFIPKNDSGTWPSGAAAAQGAYAGWSIPTTGYTGIAGGNIASLLTFSNGQFVSNYLYRNNVGNPSLNTMNTPIIMASTQTNGGACSTNGAFAQDGTGLTLTCQNNVWVSNTACPQFSGDLNLLEGNPGTQMCVNGKSMANAPTGDWYFVNVQRHANGANYYAVQTAAPMTGANVGSKYIRVQQSGTAGNGWGAWNKVVTQDAYGNVVIPGNLTANTLIPSLIATEGSACPLNGAIASSNTGGILTCQGGVWAAPSRTLQCNQYSVGYATAPIASCPSGYTKVGWDTWGRDNDSAGGFAMGSTGGAPPTIFCCK